MKFKLEEDIAEEIVIYDSTDDKLLIEKFLTEKNVVYHDAIRIYINTGHEECHNLPHVHVDFKGQKNYCSINLIDYSILQPECGIRENIKEKTVNILKQYINKAKEIWNSCNNNVKFIVDKDGKFTDNIKYEK